METNDERGISSRTSFNEIQQNLDEVERNLVIGIDLLGKRGKSLSQLQKEASSLASWSKKYLNETIAVKEEAQQPLVDVENWWKWMVNSLKKFWNYILLFSVLFAVIVSMIIGIVLNSRSGDK